MHFQSSHVPSTEPSYIKTPIPRHFLLPFTTNIQKTKTFFHSHSHTNKQTNKQQQHSEMDVNIIFTGMDVFPYKNETTFLSLILTLITRYARPHRRL